MARREEILDAATELFAQHGYSDAVTQALAERLQVGKGTLYRHFPSKQELFLAAADRVIPLGEFADATVPSDAAGPPLAASAEDQSPDPVDPGAQRTVILDALRRLISAADGPLHLPVLGKRIHHELGGWVRRSRFGGAGTLARLIEGNEDLVLETGPGGGWLYDPRRHAPPSLVQPDLPPPADAPPAPRVAEEP